MKILGVMTGTSCDGLDAACVGFEGKNWKPLWERSVAYPKELREKVLSLQKEHSKHSLRALLDLDRELGDWYGRVISRMLQSVSIRTKDRPDLIANHGQTVAHFPGVRGQGRGTTLQLGDATRIATATGLSVISHFRQGDLAAGGEGAPLVPVFHQLLVCDRLKIRPGIAVHNIGGMSNLSYFGPNRFVLSFDTGPGNIWMDAAVKKYSQGQSHFDSGGQIALAHTPDHQRVLQILKHPFFKLAPPKSTGRDDFPFQLLQKSQSSKSESARGNLVATATEVTVRSIVEAYARWIVEPGYPLHEIYLSGGGVRNRALVQGLQKAMPRVQVRSVAELGVRPQFVEAQAFAYLGYLSLQGQSVGGSWTGASQFGPPGQITPGQNWKKILKMLK